MLKYHFLYRDINREIKRKGIVYENIEKNKCSSVNDDMYLNIYDKNKRSRGI